MNHSDLPLLVVVAGPTGVGKTRLAIAVAQHFGTEIISADSRQCYKGMTIGTAQPDAEERLAVTHHFVDCFDPTQHISAADYEQYALERLERLFRKQAIAVVCGGTGLYIQALCNGLDEMPAVSTEIVLEVEQLYQTKGLTGLQEALQTEDPEFVTHEWHNAARLIRALSFFRAHGKSILHYRSGQNKSRPFRVIKIALDMQRSELYSRINSRVDQMIQAGLEEEVRQLMPLRSLKNLNTVGYAELFAYFEGSCSRETAIDKIKQHSRNYAKRQLTWFRKDHSFVWLDANSNTLIRDTIALIERKMAE